MATTAEPMAKPCPTCGHPKYRPVAHADWCWTADPSQPVAGADFVVGPDHKITIAVRDERRHPDACASCGCIRRHAWWCPSCPLTSSPGRVGVDSGGEALGEVNLALALSDRRSA